MHLSIRQSQTLEEGEIPVNPDQSPAKLLMLSFSDSDLACMASAYRQSPESHSLRLKNLAPLKHPMSVDLYIEQVASHAKVIIARIVGGYEWWHYGLEELARIAREKNIVLVLIPGDGRPDERLATLSTVSPSIIAALDECFAHGGVENARRALACLNALADETAALPLAEPLSSGALYRSVTPQEDILGQATIIFYRAHYLAADTAPIDVLLEVFAAHHIAARAFMITSLKEPRALANLREDIAAHRPDIIIDVTAFSAGGEDSDSHPLANVGAPILQCAMANISRESWENSMRGFGSTDLAMHIVLPEADGRVFTRAISFKAESEINTALEFTHVIHRPELDRIAYVAELAKSWICLGKTDAAKRRIGLVLSDYPDRAGRSAYAVGLDGPQSTLALLHQLRENGYSIDCLPESGSVLLAALQSKAATESYSLSNYRQRLNRLPSSQQQRLAQTWGLPEDDLSYSGDAFHFPLWRAGNVTVALQPDRGSSLDRKAGYHDATIPPRHGYLAFYWWLRDAAKMDALIHLGTHGNLEWLPGKSVALSADCWPEIALGPTPVIYPYIVSDPGEAAQAKRRISAVTLSHMTPPLMPVSLSPELAMLETLVDEFSSADGLDARRMKLLHEEIIHRARTTGFPGTEISADENVLMNSLEAHLCDIKEQRVGDGLHIFGHDAPNEMHQLLAALNGKFVPPGPGGSPARGRMDVLPTGRNLVTIDPRTIPTRTASLIGKRAAEEFVRRYMQDHGDWPKSVVIDVWGSATLRNGGDEIAQALYLMGIEALWDATTQRVSGFEIIPIHELAWPRIEVSLRISGLFRDMFSNLIILFDDASRAIAKLEGWQQSWRIFGSAPGAYGAGVNSLIDSGHWTKRDELGQAYMKASHFAYGRDTDGTSEPALLATLVANADALIHVQDQREMDVLSGADFADAEGGFSAAASMLGNTPSLYHLDTSQPQTIKARTLAEEISLTLHARALNTQWIKGQMRHGYAGGAALADVVDQLFAFAATAQTVNSAQFDATFTAYIFDETVREFLVRENPAALQAMINRFLEALERGLWNPLRNSTKPLLDTLQGARKEMAA